ncbi:MAG: tetratricopeptide repeat protein [Thermonemataceae bacterium]
MDRITQLKQYLEESPDDPFLYYALATEYTQKDVEKAIHYYEILLARFPAYTGTYYHAAALYEALEEIEKARLVYEKGITVLTEQQAHKLLEELKNAYYNFQMEYDE